MDPLLIHEARADQICFINLCNSETIEGDPDYAIDDSLFAYG